MGKRLEPDLEDVLCGQEEEIDVLRQHFTETTDLETSVLLPLEFSCTAWTMPC